jgi:hypothetical protein
MGIADCTQDIFDDNESKTIENTDETSSLHTANNKPSIIEVVCSDGTDQTEPKRLFESKMDISAVLSIPNYSNETNLSVIFQKSNVFDFLEETDLFHSLSESVLPGKPEALMAEKANETEGLDPKSNFFLISMNSDADMKTHCSFDAVDNHNEGKNGAEWNGDTNSFMTKNTVIDEGNPSPQVEKIDQTEPLDSAQEASSVSEEAGKIPALPSICVSDVLASKLENQQRESLTSLSQPPKIMIHHCEHGFGSNNNLNRPEISDKGNSDCTLPEALYFEFVPTCPKSLWKSNLLGEGSFEIIATQSSKLLSIDPELSIMQEEEGACPRSFSRRMLLMCEKQMNEALSARSCCQEYNLKSLLADVPIKPLNHCSTIISMCAELGACSADVKETDLAENENGFDNCLRTIFESTVPQDTRLDPLDISRLASRKAFECSGLQVTHGQNLKKMQQSGKDLYTEDEETQATEMDELNTRDDPIAIAGAPFLAEATSEVDDNLLSTTEDTLDVCLMSTTEETLDDDLSAFMAAEGYTVLPVKNGTGATHGLSTASVNPVQQIMMSPKASSDAKYHVFRVHVADDTPLAQVMLQCDVSCFYFLFRLCNTRQYFTSDA